jgi:hypothetical protein
VVKEFNVADQQKIKPLFSVSMPIFFIQSRIGIIRISRMLGLLKLEKIVF